jgi:hypothetical protein
LVLCQQAGVSRGIVDIGNHRRVGDFDVHSFGNVTMNNVACFGGGGKGQEFFN